MVRELIALMNNARLHAVLGRAVIGLLYTRLASLCGTLERLMARFEAGTLSTGRPRLTQRAAPTALTWPRPARIWPPGFGWLVQLMAHRAVGHGSQLQAILEHPQMAALLAASPQARRVLRPLCRMLAVRNLVISPARVVREKSAPRQRVRAPRAKVDWGRIPLPRGMLAKARRDGFYKGG